MCLVDFIDRWQTLITGFLALGAAYWTVRPLREQIQLQKLQIESERKSKAWSAKARLPDALSAICHYTVQMAAWLRNPNSITPELPIEGIKEIKDVIEFVEPKTSKRLFDLLNRYQVHRARSRDLFQESGRISEVPIPFELQDTYYDLAHLNGLAISVFDYARNEAQEGPENELSSEEMLSSLRSVIGLHYYGNEDNYRGVLDTIERRHIQESSQRHRS